MHVRWPGIESFEHLRFDQQKSFKRNVEMTPNIFKECEEQYNDKDTFIGTFKAKIKLHGTNSGISYQPNKLGQNELFPQSRNRVLSLETDQYGFASWTFGHKEYFESIFQKIEGQKKVIFGEWAGKGINSGASVCKLSERIFAVFSLQVDETLIIDPSKISSLLSLDSKENLPNLKPPENIYVIPWFKEEENSPDLELDLDLICDSSNTEKFPKLEKSLEKIDQIVKKIDKEDPYIRSKFNISGNGEGLVFYPISFYSPYLTIFFSTTKNNVRNEINIPHFWTKFLFKCKGPSHRVVEKKKLIQESPESSESISQFVSQFVTEGRCEQGINTLFGKDIKDNEGNVKETSLVFEKKDVPKFLKWILEDIEKEAGPELEKSGLTWNNVKKACSDASREYFFKRIKSII